VVMLCANKADVDPAQWTVSREEFTNFAAAHKYTVFETSASSGLNVTPLFYELSKQILKTSKSELQEMKSERESIILFEPPKPERMKKKSGWC
jgi:GTPase SAR1 family protein